MAKEQNHKERPLVSMTREEREEMWDDVFVKEEGIILAFDSDLNTGKIKSIADGQIYSIDGRELLRTKIELRAGDKVFFRKLSRPIAQITVLIKWSSIGGLPSVKVRAEQERF